jgi:hypothetical protein
VIASHLCLENAQSLCLALAMRLYLEIVQDLSLLNLNLLCSFLWLHLQLKKTMGMSITYFDFYIVLGVDTIWKWTVL